MDVGPRALGLLIDVIFMAIVGDILRDVHLTALATLIYTAYFVYYFSTSGQTLGMLAMHIKVVRVDGRPLSWTTGMLRYVGYLLSLPLFLGFLWAMFDPHRQGWHDKIAGTIVVRAA